MAWHGEFLTLVRVLQKVVTVPDGRLNIVWDSLLEDNESGFLVAELFKKCHFPVQYFADFFSGYSPRSVFQGFVHTMPIIFTTACWTLRKES